MLPLVVHSIFGILLLLLAQMGLDNRRSRGLNLALPIRFLRTFKSPGNSSQPPSASRCKQVEALAQL